MSNQYRFVLPVVNIVFSRTLILYFFIGASASLVDIVGFFLLFNLYGVAAVVATAVSVSLATVYSFVLNVKFNFKVSDRLGMRLALFSLVSGIGLLLSALALYIAHDVYGIDGNIVKIASLPVIFFVQFILNKHISFRSNNV